jgi:outer membrane protein
MLCILVSVMLLGAGALHAQGIKIAYVNSGKILQELPAAQDAQKRIEAISKPFQDSLDAMQKDLQGRYEEYQKKEALMTDAAKKTEQQKLVEMDRRINEYRVEKFGNDGELAKQSERIFNPIREKIKGAIATVAKEEKYSFVFDKTEQIQILLYGDPNHDITYKVLDKLKRGK